MKKTQERAEFLDRMLKQVHELPVVEVVGAQVELFQRGRYCLGLCPFHPDQHLGSFVVTPEMNIWRCFAEGVGGDPIKFEMMYFELSYLQAAFRLALEYNIITEDEYRKYSRKKWDEKEVENIRERVEEPVKKKKGKRADAAIINAVYDAIPKVCGLSAAHRRHLLQERFLKEDCLVDYFTFPTRRMDLADKVFRYLCEQKAQEIYGTKLSGLQKDQLKNLEKIMESVSSQIRYVPGFFYDERTKKVDFSSYKGIGMVLRNEKGEATGIQIRRDTVKEGESRYVWFSSAFAQSLSYADGGASSGSPGGFIPAKPGPNPPQICITEGRFKAEKIAEKGNDVLYVSGVSTWKSVIPMIRNISNGRKAVFLMFDADMLGNVAVHRQLKAMESELSAMGFRTNLILWSKKYGKGFDDLVINKGSRYASYLKTMRYLHFADIYSKVLGQALGIYEVKEVREIQKDRANDFSEDLQDMMEKALELKKAPA